MLHLQIVTTTCSDDRAKNRRERRAGADKLQAEGNAAFKQGDLKKALHLYSDGIDMCKDHKQLRTNRALVCNKLGRYPEAIEDCTKVLDICELFEGNSGPGVKEARLKSLSRRATAYKVCVCVCVCVCETCNSLQGNSPPPPPPPPPAFQSRHRCIAMCDM